MQEPPADLQDGGQGLRVLQQHALPPRRAAGRVRVVGNALPACRCSLRLLLPRIVLQAEGGPRLQPPRPLGHAQRVAAAALAAAAGKLRALPGGNRLSRGGHEGARQHALGVHVLDKRQRRQPGLQAVGQGAAGGRLGGWHPRNSGAAALQAWLLLPSFDRSSVTSSCMPRGSSQLSP